MSAEEWIERFSQALGTSPPGEEDMAQMLDLASVAAHASERRAAPIACWLAAAAGLSPADAIEVAKRLQE